MAALRRLSYTEWNPSEVTIYLACNTKLNTGRHMETVKEHDLLMALLSSSADSLYFKDLESRFILISKTLSDAFGLKSPDLAIGKSDFDFFSIEHAQVAYDAEQNIIKNNHPIINFEEKEVWPDGRLTWASTSKMPLRDANGQVVGTFGISRNITARKNAEQERDQLNIELQHVRKMESIGQLAAGIAHEINTPTQYVSDNLSFLDKAFRSITPVLEAADKFSSNTTHASNSEFAAQLKESAAAAQLGFFISELPAALEQSKEGVSRITTIVSAMKSFSHPSDGEMQLVNMQELLETTVTVARNEWRYVADVNVDVEDNMPEVQCFRSELSQVVLNLLVNASHAIESDLEGSERKRGVINISAGKSTKGVFIKLSDDGCGMSDEVKVKIFDPFFTTKEVGKGTGQGLSIAYTVIVNKHAGSISVNSTPGKGTEFLIEIPLKHNT